MCTTIWTFPDADSGGGGGCGGCGCGGGGCGCGCGCGGVVVVVQQVLSASLNCAQHTVKMFIINFGRLTHLHQRNFIPVYGIFESSKLSPGAIRN